MVALRRGTMSAPSHLTLQEAAEEWITGARSGAILNRSGDRYKPSVVCSYEADARAADPARPRRAQAHFAHPR